MGTRSTTNKIGSLEGETSEQGGHRGIIIKITATMLASTLLLAGLGYLQIKERFIPQWSFNQSDWGIKGDSVYVDPNKDGVPDSVFAYSSNAVTLSEAESIKTSNDSLQE